MAFRPRKRHILYLILLLLIAGIILRYLSPLPAVQAKTYESIYNEGLNNVATPPSLAWPSYGQSAIGAEGYGLLAAHGSQTPVPIASIAKLVLALNVLDKKPFSLPDKGPDIPLTDKDVAIYQQDLSQDGSVIPVQAGQSVNEYEMLEALLLPSANNIADTLANWAFGSVDSYISAANSYLSARGIKNTHIADASGFSASTTSTASDLVEIGQIAMQNPSISEVVSQRLASISIANTIYNVNTLLGHENIIGIKTGNTDQAGGCFLFAAKRTIGNGGQVTTIGAILSAPDLKTAMNDSLALLASSDNGFESKKIVGPNDTIAEYKVPWNGTAKVVPKQAIDTLVWKGTSIRVKIDARKIKPPLQKGSQVGTVQVIAGAHTTTVPAILDDNITNPSLTWRILR